MLYTTKESWTISWIHKHFTANMQNTQRIESINRHIYNKLDRAILLCDLLYGIKDYVKNDEYLEKFEIEWNTLFTIGMPILSSRFFGQVDYVLKEFLTTVMLGK